MHPQAYNDASIEAIEVEFKSRSFNGMREKRVAVFVRRKLQGILKSSLNYPYYKTIELIRETLDNLAKSASLDKMDIKKIRVVVRGTSGFGGNTIAADVRVP